MNTTIVFMVSAAVAAILHTLVPYHEIPLAMRTQYTRNYSEYNILAGDDNTKPVEEGDLLEGF